VFQNPDSTLNPAHSIEFALVRPLRLLRGLKRREARAQAADLLRAVRLPPDVLRRKPHQLSGGQRQRVAIARALAGQPDLMIADEPVSALDISVQAAIINLLGDLQRELDMTYLVISHDLGMVRYIADWVAVMYKGELVDSGPTESVFENPTHSYTRELIDAARYEDVI
jgi:ABC-type glutathione transport system ATPase component